MQSIKYSKQSFEISNLLRGKIRKSNIDNTRYKDIL